VPFQYVRRSNPGAIVRNAQGVLMALPGLPEKVANADGIGDISFVGRYWLMRGGNEKRQNVAIGLGIKLPTGDYDSTDDPLIGGKRFKNVVNDQSIQAGDGGTGLIMEVQGYKGIGPVTFYGSATYLANPKEHGADKTFTSPDTTPADLAAKTGEKFLSVSDQYSIRIGGIVPLPRKGIFKGMAISMGLRDEGVPATDLFGGNKGFRRPGYAISADPGFTYSFHHDSFAFNMPIALVRDRTRNIIDIFNRPRSQGDAAFSDYSIQFSYSHHF
jgi:hypothetical protein